jgi:hypothetical protein
MHQIKRKNIRSAYLLNVLIILVLSGCSSEKETEPEIMPPDPAVGDWHGVLISEDGRSDSLAVQVIGYENQTYQANFLKNFDTREPKLAIMKGNTQGTFIEFEGEGAGTRWEGRLTGDKFSGKVHGEREAAFALEKTVRKSPTLGLGAPENAVVLFAGQSLDQWEHVRDPAGYINLSRMIGGNNRVAYLFTRINSVVEKEVQLETGSDDGIKVWLNGKPVAAVNASRTAAPGQNKLKIVLSAGWNTLLVKINNGDGGWGGYIRLTTPDGKTVTGVKPEDPDHPDEFDPIFPEKTDGFITRWKVAGPYMRNNLPGKDLFDVEFDPEQSDPAKIDWRLLDPDTVNYKPKWKIKDGSMQVSAGSGNLISRRKFGSAKMHVEFRSPYMPAAKGQERGNSGVYIQGRYEIQVLDSYGLEGADNECGGIYKVSRPRVNMCAPPWQWQTYDIDFKAPQFDSSDKKTSNARISVRHNGVLIHENLALPGVTGGAVDTLTEQPGGLMLQDHGNPVEYRNIWVLPVDDRTEEPR